MADELIRLDANSRWVLAAVDADTDEIRNLHMDESNRALHVNLWVWDTVAVDWARMVQPTIEFDGDLTVTMGDVEALLADNYWKRSHTYDWGSGNIKYLCRNTDIDAGYADTDWWIWKYEDKDNAGSEGPRLSTGGVATVGAIDALSWNI